MGYQIAAHVGLGQDRDGGAVVGRMGQHMPAQLVIGCLFFLCPL
uniref:Uncharacterized protein n=1 Tax=Arundo donax TaxID=35708 RepID=A0A0A9F8E1_ARUDO